MIKISDTHKVSCWLYEDENINSPLASGTEKGGSK